MNKTLAETREYIRELARGPLPTDATLFIVPPFTALSTARDELVGTPIHLGGQTMHWADRGAHTGEVSPLMLRDCGVELVELGHSERRSDQAETDSTVNAKVRAALAHGLRPLVCVGDREEELRADATVETVTRQVKLALAGADRDKLGQSLIAYEPVWAIGEAGRVAEPGHVARVHGALRAMLDGLGLSSVPVLYGGSVAPDNAGAMAAIPSVDGLFVGRAAWTAEGLLRVASAALKGRASVSHS